LAEFAKDNQLPKIKAGFLSQAPLSTEKINQLAQLPGKTELLAQTVSAIKAPLSGFAHVLSGNLRNLVYILEAIKKDKNN
jgi:large subunit ribosomal protein L10